MALLTREQFLGRTKLPSREVALGDGNSIRIRQPSALEWDDFDFQASHFRARLVCQFAVDEKGRRLFEDQDINKLLLVGADLIEAAAAEIMDAAGATRKAMERLAKNLSTASGSSSTASPATSDAPAS